MTDPGAGAPPRRPARYGSRRTVRASRLPRECWLGRGSAAPRERNARHQLRPRPRPRGEACADSRRAAPQAPFAGQAEAQDHRVAVGPALDGRRVGRPRGREKNQNRRFGHGGCQSVWATPPGRSTSAAIADRRSRTAIVVLRSLRRDPRLDREPYHFKIAHCRRVSRLSAGRLSYPPQRRGRGGRLAMLAPAGGLCRSRCSISFHCILTRSPGRQLFPAIGRSEERPYSRRATPSRRHELPVDALDPRIGQLTLPVAGVGGDVVGARLVHQRGI